MSRLDVSCTTKMDELYDILKINLIFGYLVLVLLPVAVALTPHKFPSVHELKVYRMHHYDLHGSRYGTYIETLASRRYAKETTSLGSRRWRFSLEAASVRARDLTRKCLVVWWNDFKPDMLESEVKKSLGAVILLIPRNLSAIAGEDKAAFMFMEERMSGKEIDLPVYFAFATPEVQHILDSVQRQNQAEEGSVLKASFLAVTANSYKLVSQNQASSLNSHFQMQNVVVSADENSTSGEVCYA
ncbi:unnamed protein product [Soboliphyme baturini]|uniref:Exostosin domain-containing protein n=1 Tax=Soboliphyme baturini TaxID=241478 RepID=A0A183J062_9BILA|nr:unnamed protein product [Soboliphyme baturini]